MVHLNWANEVGLNQCLPYQAGVSWKKTTSTLVDE
jgi:hypothetical protein